MDATRLGPSLSKATVSLINCSRSAARRAVSFSTGLLCDWIHAPKQKLSKRKRAAIEAKAFQRGRVDAVRQAVAQFQVP